MSKYIDKAINQYIKYIRKNKKQSFLIEFSHIMKDFIDRKQKVLDVDDHMMDLNVQNILENLRNGIDFAKLENGEHSKSIYSEKRIVIDEKYKNITLDDDNLYYYIKLVKIELERNLDYLEDKEGNLIKYGIAEVKDGELTGNIEFLNDIFTELKVLEVSEEIVDKDTTRKNINDNFELTRKIVRMWAYSLLTTEEEISKLATCGYKQFVKKVQDLDSEFASVLNKDVENNYYLLKQAMEKSIQDNEESSELKQEIANLFEFNYIFCMRILKNRIYNYFKTKNIIQENEINEYFEYLLENRCKLRDLYNTSIREYAKCGHIATNYFKSKEVKKEEKELNLIIERIFNLKSDNRLFRKFNDNEKPQYKEIITNYIINAKDDERENKRLLETIVNIDTNNFVKYTVSSTSSKEYIKVNILLDRRLKYRVEKAIKSRIILEKIAELFKKKEKVLSLQESKEIIKKPIELKETINKIIDNVNNKEIDIYE